MLGLGCRWALGHRRPRRLARSASPWWPRRSGLETRKNPGSELVTPKTAEAIKRGLDFLSRGTRRRLVWFERLRAQRGGRVAGWHGAHRLGEHARPRAVRPARGPLYRFRPREYRGKRLHQRHLELQPRTDVRPRLRHAVSCRMLWDVAAARAAREADPGRGADRQHAKHRRRLALTNRFATVQRSRTSR